MTPGLQVFPYVYCRREARKNINNKNESLLITWVGLKENNEYFNDIFVSLASFNPGTWIDNPGNAPI